MKRGLIAGAIAVFAVALMLDTDIMGGDNKPVSIKVVMQKAMKGGLCKKVASGKASDDEKKELVSLFTDLAKDTPPKGDADDWKMKTKALLDAAKAADGEALMKAANCKACHDLHKGKK